LGEVGKVQGFKVQSFQGGAADELNIDELNIEAWEDRRIQEWFRLKPEPLKL